MSVAEMMKVPYYYHSRMGHAFGQCDFKYTSSSFGRMEVVAANKIKKEDR